MFTCLSDDQMAAFDRDGYVMVRSMFAPEETAALHRTAQADRAMQAAAMNVPDNGGRISKISLWNHPGDDIYGMVARCRRMVRSMERVLGGEVYHYHSKLMLKEPEVGGAWVWHQDYGYWYQNACLFPLLASCFIAVDGASKENGCLQALRGSHAMGRVDHIVVGGQLQADPERVEQAKARLPLDYMEMEPGDAAFFHCNLLHRSDANRSRRSRWTLICCYNAARNDPYADSQHPHYTPLEVVPDTAVLDAGLSGRIAARNFMKPDDDVSTERRTARAAVAPAGDREGTDG